MAQTLSQAATVVTLMVMLWLLLTCTLGTALRWSRRTHSVWLGFSLICAALCVQADIPVLMVVPHAGCLAGMWLQPLEQHTD